MRTATLRTVLGIATLLFGLTLTQPAHSQTNSGQSTSPPAQQQHVPPATQSRSPGGEVGSGAGDIGKGAADLVTLHPIDAAGNVGKGAAIGGKDVAVGTTKGTGKVFKGIGRGIKHIF
jgi:hypothetical protein